MTILEERGLFWWADEVVPKTKFAPDSCCAGQLVISDDGRPRVELDGYLPGKHGPIAHATQHGQSIEKEIQGLLKTSNKQVLLTGLVRDGGEFKSNGMSFEHYSAAQCLVTERFADLPTARVFNRIVIPFSGLEAWLRLANIKVTPTKRTISIKYKQPNDAVYSTTDGRLSIHFEDGLESNQKVFRPDVSLKESASATLSFNEPLALKDLIDQHRLLEDLLLVLTGSDYTLDWPLVGSDASGHSRLYFQKFGARAASPPEAHECITNFRQLRQRFGDIWSEWKKKRETFGPGFYLYLGTRRGVSLYIENRFINLAFGLEAFHRRKYLSAQQTKLDAKIKRIIAQVRLTRDRKWLVDMLEHASEPSLGQRLYETLREVPLDLDQKRLERFCKLCGKLRNDISHFGGQRDNSVTYNDFIHDLESKSRALAALYLALLQHEIGVDAKIIKAWMFEGFGSFPIKHHFVKADLLDESVLRPAPPPGPSADR